MAKQNPIHRAVLIAGGQAAVARALSAVRGRKITPQAVQGWIRRFGKPNTRGGKFYVPGPWVPHVVKITQGMVTAHELNPECNPEAL
jgi:DNA-binding transcriptional regulator YdaS (Cro superfamily)